MCCGTGTIGLSIAKVGTRYLATSQFMLELILLITNTSENDSILKTLNNSSMSFDYNFSVFNIEMPSGFRSGIDCQRRRRC